MSFSGVGCVLEPGGVVLDYSLLFETYEGTCGQASFVDTAEGSLELLRKIAVVAEDDRGGLGP